ILNDTKLGTHVDVTDAAPYTMLPDARVLVTSQLVDGSTGLASLGFGGNASLPRSSRVSGAELTNQTSWNSLDNKHRWRVTAAARIDRLDQTSGGNALGTFTYNSIADIQANRPASFARSFSTRDILSEVETGALAVGDQWRVVDRVDVTYGLRLDANALGNSLAYNPAVDSVFGVR